MNNRLIASFNLMKSRCLFFVSPLILFVIWQLVVSQGVVSDQLLPSPWQIMQRLVVTLANDDFFPNLFVTLFRLVMGLGLAIVFGTAIGLASQVSKNVAFFIGGIVKILAPIPKIALYPALVLILGFDHSSKVALITLDAIFPILMATWAAAQNVDEKLVWSARSVGTSKLGLAYKVYLPAILPTLLAGIRVASVIACVVVFLAEMIASTDGLGHMLTAAARSYVIVDMFVPLVWICAIGMTLNYAIGKIQQHLRYE